MIRAGTTLLLSLTIAACGGPGGPDLEWAFEIPVGVPIHEHAPVPLADRQASWVRPALDLTIEGTGGELLLEFAYSLAVDSEGRIFVLDQVAQNIKVFGPDGASLGVLAGPGQGPGELSEVAPALTAAGNRLIVADALSARFSTWSTDGEFLETLVLPGGDAVAAESEALHGFDDGSFAAAYPARDIERGETLRFVRMDAGGVVVNEFARLPLEYTRAIISGRPGVLPMPRGRAQMAATPGGRVYLTPADLYQVAAYDITGAMQWALRVPWPRGALPANAVDDAFDSASRGLRAMGESPVLDHDSVENVPESFPALASLKVDGRGRLWAFPYVHGSLAAEEPHPVDVYSSDGARLFSGLIEARFARSRELGSAWIVARGDWIYGLETDLQTDTQSVVRHRLDVSF